MSDLNLAVKLTLQSAEFQAGLVRAVRDADKFGSGVTAGVGKASAGLAQLPLSARLGMSQARPSVDALSASVAKVGGTAAASGDQLRRLGGEARATLTGIASSLAAAAGAGSFVQTLQAVQDTDTRLKALNTTSQDYARSTGFLTELAAEHHKSVLDLADSYTRLLPLEQSGLVTRRQAQQILRGLSDAQSATGASAEQLGQVMFGLAQGLSAGTLRAEELNQVTEPLPGLLQKLDQAAGLTAGGFRRLVNDGQVTSQMFAQTLVQALASYDGAAARTAGNISAKFGDIANAWANLVKSVDASPLVSALNTVTAAIDRMTAASRYWEKQGGFINGITGGAFQGTGPGAFTEDQQVEIYKRDIKALQDRALPPPASGAAAAATPPAPTGGLREVKYDKSRAAAIADYLESRGLAPMQVAGIVGNLAQEAPGGRGTFGTAMSGDQGSVGLAQWRLDRKDALQAYAGSRGAPVTDLKTQLDFLLTEAKKRGDLNAMLSASSPAEASKIFADRFERPDPARADYDYRAAVAADIYDRSSIDSLKSTAGKVVGAFDVGRSLDQAQADIESLNAAWAKYQTKTRERGQRTFDQMTQDLSTAAEEQKAVLAAKAEYEKGLNAQAQADFERRQSEQRTFLDDAYQAKLITSQDYYARLQRLADAELENTRARIDAEMTAEREKAAELTRLIDTLRAKNQSTGAAEIGLIQSQARQSVLNGQRAEADAQYRAQSRQITTGATAAQAGSGQSGGIQEFVDRYNAGLGDMQQFTFTALNGMQNTLANFFETGMQGTESLGAAFGKMAQRIAAEIAAMMVTKAVVSFIGMIGGGLGGAASGAAAGASGAIGGTTALATGGLIAGPGTGTSDSILARVSDGEYVVNAAAVKAVGVQALHRINSLGTGLPRFATGGVVGASAAAGAWREGAQAISISMPMTIQTGGGTGGFDENRARALQRELRAAVDQRVLELKRPGGLLYG
jgi:lambda family phage tail tape measure protein